jgi:hypothetical protein
MIESTTRYMYGVGLYSAGTSASPTWECYATCGVQKTTNGQPVNYIVGHDALNL